VANTGWTANVPDSVMVCDLNGIILEMNDKAAEMYRKYGGMELVGKNLFDCHPEPARGKLKRLLETGDRNIYTIEKNGIRKMIYQVPWYQDGRRSGMIELSFEFPADLPHFVRK